MKEKFGKQLHVLGLNCALSPHTIFKDIISQFDGNAKSTDQQKELKKRLLANKKISANIIILDEVDRLTTLQEQKALKSLIEISTTKDTKLILITVANNPELSQKKLGNIKFEEKIIFRPYDSQQIENIINKRLEDIKMDTLVNPKVVTFISKKMEGDSGKRKQKSLPSPN